MTFTAHFQDNGTAPHEFSLIFVTDGTPGAQLNGSTSQTVNQGGSSSPVTALAPGGYSFTKWTDSNGTEYSNNPITINNVTANMTFTAHFQDNGATPDEFSLTFVTDGTPGAQLNGSISQTVSQGGLSSPVTALAPGGYSFTKWTDSNGIEYSNNPITVNNVTSNMTFTAHFQNNGTPPHEFSLIFVTDGTSGAQLNGLTSQSVSQGGSTSPVTAVAPDGYSFTKWTDSNGTEYSNNPITVNNVTSNMTFIAHFSESLEKGYSLGSYITVNSKDNEKLGEKFVKTPLVYGVYTDKTKNRTMKGNTKSVVKIKTPQSQYTCYWNKKARLFNYSELKKSLKNGVNTFEWLIQNPIEPLECMLNIKISKPQKLDIELKKIQLMPPLITSVEMSGKDTFENGVYNLKNQSQITLYGKYFGTKVPIVAIEMQINGQYKYRRLKVLKNFKYNSPKGIPRKSPMNPETGESQLTVTIALKEIKPGLYNLILFNKLGITAIPVKF
jgi:uncharacterized repeat protein (TIGR02543 family)